MRLAARAGRLGCVLIKHAMRHVRLSRQGNSGQALLITSISPFDPSRTSRHVLSMSAVGRSRSEMLGVSLSAKRSHWNGAEVTLASRTSHILIAFATSVSPHSYKGRMK